VESLIHLYSSIYRGKPGGITVTRVHPYTCYKGISLGLDDTVDLPFDLIRRAVLWDLNSTYSRFGDLTIYQKEGLPIGGLCSSVYADIQCSFDENNFLSNNDTISYGKDLLCIRQIDDLLIITDDESKKDMVIAAYDKGLTLEAEEVRTIDRSGVLTHKLSYIGLDLTFTDGDVRSKVSNLNVREIASTDKQAKPRFPPISSYRQGSMYKQVIMTALFRIRDFSIGAAQIRCAIQGLFYELTWLGYLPALFISTLKRFIRIRIPKTHSKIWLSTLASLKP
jgi:hypothetical protein